MIAKLITAYGKPTVLFCDANCEKAFGISTRPKIQLSDDPDDYAFLADGELGEAPRDTGNYEGECGKPYGGDFLNKWCFRQCERSESSSTPRALIELKDWAVRQYNQPQRRMGAATMKEKA